MRDRRADQPVYVISIAATLAGTHPRTLRIYEERGLLAPQRRNRIRLYSDQDIERVRLIRYFTQEMGVNLAGVKLLLQMYEERQEGQTQGTRWSVTRRILRAGRDEGQGRGGKVR